MTPEKIHKSRLKLLYIDVLRGYSEVIYGSFGNIFLKHFTSLDVGDIDIQHDLYFQKAKGDGLPTRDEQEEYIIKEGLWTEKKNSLISEYREYLQNLRTTKSKLIKQSDINHVNKIINEYDAKLDELVLNKELLLQNTAENYAAKRVNEYYIFNAIFKNRDLTIRLFSKEEFDDLDDETLLGLTDLYNDTLKNFNDINLKRIALFPSFFNLFCLSDSAYTFYGKPIVSLTFYQAEIYGHAQYFKRILSESNSKVPAHLFDDPDKLIEWHNTQQNAKEVLDKSESKNASSLIGLSREDRERLGIEEEESPYEKMVKAAAANGGSLNFNEISKFIAK